MTARMLVFARFPSSAGRLRQQGECLQACMAMRRAGGRPDRWLRWQDEQVATTLAFGLVDPPRETLDARLVRESGYASPVEHDVGAKRLFVFAHQQRVATCRRFPRDRAAPVATAIGAQVVHVVAGRIEPRVRGVAGTQRQRRSAAFGRGIDQQWQVGPDIGPSLCQSERTCRGNSETLGFQPAALHGCQRQIGLARAVVERQRRFGITALHAQAAAFASRLGARMHADPQRRARRHGVGAECRDLQAA